MHLLYETNSSTSSKEPYRRSWKLLNVRTWYSFTDDTNKIPKSPSNY